jgi:hypothetical protein
MKCQDVVDTKSDRPLPETIALIDQKMKLIILFVLDPFLSIIRGNGLNPLSIEVLGKQPWKNFPRVYPLTPEMPQRHSDVAVHKPSTLCESLLESQAVS